MASFEPHRGDEVEAWIKRTRDTYSPASDGWHDLDALLDDYRLHADTGVALEFDVPTGEGWTH